MSQNAAGPATPVPPTAEATRLAEDASRAQNWKRWGPYLSERQWGTIREDYSAGGTCWEYFPHDHARSRAYRWGEDGLLGLCDRECRLCFAVALWNGRDPILKERLFGLTGDEGNHGEDVKECYYYLDSTPTHSYMKALYKYPQAEFPYARLVEESRRRGKADPEFELEDTGVFDAERYFDVQVEYAKADPDDILIRITVTNRGPDPAAIHLLPTLWFRNTWSWGRSGGTYWTRPLITGTPDGRLRTRHETLGEMHLALELDGSTEAPRLLFTENDTNSVRLFGVGNPASYVKDAFHQRVVGGQRTAVNPQLSGTKAAAWYEATLPPGGTLLVRGRLSPDPGGVEAGSESFEHTFARRIQEADEYYASRTHVPLPEPAREISRQAYAGLLWSKQFYHYIVSEWLSGDPAQPAPPASRLAGRNRDWRHLYTRDVLSMPDKWEYPWFAAWDLAFHMIPMAQVDPQLAKEQLLLFLREWYMHPNGQLPAYEFAFGDVNPPVHAWACWRVYKMTGPRGGRDIQFLKRAFQKLLINFTWWVNRKDLEGNNLFSGGFLGLDNVGVFDRSKPLPGGGHLEQADGTAWMAFYCATMLSMALELALEDISYEDVASKFFEHFVAISDAMNTLGGTGLWDDEDGFYYDQMHTDGVRQPVKVRSMVGVIPLFACEVLDQRTIDRLPAFKKRMEWFLENRGDLARHISYMETQPGPGAVRRLLAIPARERLTAVLRYVLDETEFLSPHGIRSLSRVHRDHPFVMQLEGEEHRVEYSPAESTTGIFGGNSNWRGPVWYPANYLLVEALERYHYFYGDSLMVECPTGSGRRMSLKAVATEIQSRLCRLFLPDGHGRRPCFGTDERYASNPHWNQLLLFHEYFDGDNGRGLGACHQTGWTALVTRSLEELARTLLAPG